MLICKLPYICKYIILHLFNIFTTITNIMLYIVMLNNSDEDLLYV